ncbi:MAG TPA: YCF48-related protein [Chloroflexota bacterium]|nr:YCF48-related protein [Chloroflexota bacterium]
MPRSRSFRPRFIARFLTVLLTVAAAPVVWQTASPVHASAAQWTLQRSSTTADLRDISCSSRSECVAVGADGTIVRTVNGGKIWGRMTVPYAAGHPDVTFTSVRCPAAGVCSVLAPPDVVLRTDDGGRHWQTNRIALPPLLAGLTRIACPTLSVCFAIASPSGLINNPFDRSPAMFKSGDDGRSWRRLSIPPSVPCPGSDCYSSRPTVGYDLNWISCQSATSCFAGGDTFLAAISHEGGFASAVLRTRNGGKTWRRVHDSFDPNIATCPTPLVCVGVYYLPRSPTWGPVLLRSTDGGTTWAGWGPTPFRPILTSIACVGSSFCELAGPKGALAMLTGMRLEVQAGPSSRRLAAVACPRASTCYAVGNHGTIVARQAPVAGR